MTGAEERVALLTRLSSEVVRTQKRYFGKGPTRARSYFLDDMLIVVMHGGLTTAEKSMLEFGEADKVRAFRQTFENDMTEQLTGVVEELTGRRVLSYQSQIMFDPDRVVEMFVFDDEVPHELRVPTGEAQVADEPSGPTGDEDVLDQPSKGGAPD